MFSSGPNYTKLKTNLRLAVTRLKLLERKKMELTQKSRKEIADYLSAGKIERAKIRVEHIIREDYMVEAMEMLEMYCDLLLARFGLLEQMKTLDAGLAEAVSSLLWAGPRLVSDVQEMKPICDQLMYKYGKQFSDACRENNMATISDKLKHKMGVESPPKPLVEKYLIEIAKNFNIHYEPDPEVLNMDKSVEALLLDLDGDDENNRNNLGGNVAPPGFKDFPPAPVPISEMKPFNFPSASGSNSNNINIGGFVVPPQPGAGVSSPLPGSQSLPNTSTNKMGFGVPFSYNIPPDTTVDHDLDGPPPSYSNFAPPDITPTLPTVPTDKNQQKSDYPKPAPRGKMSPTDVYKPNNTDLFPELPKVPSHLPNSSSSSTSTNNNNNNVSCRKTKDYNDDDIDFDDLTKRFELLKQKK